MVLLGVAVDAVEAELSVERHPAEAVAVVALAHAAAAPFANPVSQKPTAP